MAAIRNISVSAVCATALAVVGSIGASPIPRVDEPASVAANAAQPSTPKRLNDLRVHFLNIGAGTCTVVEPPGQSARPLIVDCGSLEATGADMDRDDAKVYVEAIVGNRPADVVISHADNDHYGWIANVLRDIRVQNIWQGGDPDDYERSGFPQWIAAQRRNGATIKTGLAAGFHNNKKPVNANLACGTAQCFVLTVNSGDSKNGQSLVLKITHGDFSVTFTGDAEGETEQDAIDNFDNVATTVLTGSHHGARTHGSNSTGWASATSPALVVFSAGRKFGHPQCEAVDRFKGEVVSTRLHPTQCGNGASYRPVQSSRKALYMTEVNGRIVVTSAGRSPFRLSCSRTPGCDADVEHR